MSPARAVALTLLSLLAFAGNSLLCRAALALLSSSSLPPQVVDPLRAALEEVVQRIPPEPEATP